MKPTDDHSNKGILNAQAGRQHFSLTRYEPADDLRPFVKRYWIVRWDLRGQAPYRQVILSHPNVNLVVEKQNTRIYGISRKTSSHLLEGQGMVLGIKFKSGGFYPFWKQPVCHLTNQSVPFSDLFGIDSRTLEEEIFGLQHDADMIDRMEKFLRPRLPEADDNVLIIERMVETIIADRDITRVEDLVGRFGFSIRTLQRLFNRYVGVSPKWVIQRYRLHEAAEQLENGVDLDWAKLSQDLGYYDQAHFIKDFKAIVGKTPEAYIKAIR